MENFYLRKKMKDYIDKTDNPNYDLHHIELPFRMVVVAPSGSGKTNYVCNLLQLFCKGKGTFDEIKIYCKSKDEPLYRYLNDETKGAIRIYEGTENLPQINELDKTKQTLYIFDDLILDIKKNPLISEYYIRARKKNCSLIFLSQNFYSIPKIMRVNTRYFTILRLAGQRDLNMILSDLSLGLSKQQLLDIYNYCTKEKMNTLMIDNDSIEGKFRKNFTEFINPENI